MIKIKTAKKGRNRFGARKYATVPSHTDKNKEYTVAKCRKRAAKHYYYVCSCPHNFYSRKTCKHIHQFLVAEKEYNV